MWTIVVDAVGNLRKTRERERSRRHEPRCSGREDSERRSGGDRRTQRIWELEMAAILLFVPPVYNYTPLRVNRVDFPNIPSGKLCDVNKLSDVT